MQHVHNVDAPKRQGRDEAEGMVHQSLVGAETNLALEVEIARQAEPLGHRESAVFVVHVAQSDAFLRVGSISFVHLFAEFHAFDL